MLALKNGPCHFTYIFPYVDKFNVGCQFKRNGHVALSNFRVKSPTPPSGPVVWEITLQGLPLPHPPPA